ncbi:TetR/AcrR family transcriptional regulator [Deinococcus aquaedulcis]|uniref:TetR/AcrR family transcriptional regulator n=1 Tax=Deinococcus aquaedulcis TaxID=2840455 RepID=UPI001C832AEB|nr:TetR/AcrR family transcriptional regulator [Deinococcus aquaedulcis]
MSRARRTAPTPLLEVLTQALVERPHASLGELAALAGVGRTTLHRLYPTREAVLRAVALDALAHLREVDEEVGLAAAFAPGTPPAASWQTLERWIERLVPLGPRLQFLVRASELDGDAELTRASAALDATLLGALERAQAQGFLSPRPPAAWLMASLHALIYVCWEQVAAGTVAPRDAAGLVFRTWLGGVGEKANG